MSTIHWFGLTLLLFVALVAAVLLLPPWSPVNVTSEDSPEVETGKLVQQPSQFEDGEEAIQTPISQNPEASLVPTPASALEEPLAPGPVTAPPVAGPGVANPEAVPDLTPAPELQVIPTATPEAMPEEPGNTPSTPVVLNVDDAPPKASGDQASPGVDALIKATEDPDWRVRWDAINALGNLKDPRAVPALVKRALLDDNSHPRWRSLWALSLVDREGSEAIPLLLTGLKDPDPLVVRNAAVALAGFRQPEARPELIRGLNDPDSFRRWEAVFSLKSIGDAEVARALISILNEEAEPVVRVRQEAALTLGRIGGEEVAPALLTALQDDSSPQVRWRAAAALSKLGDASVVGELEQALSTEEDLQVRENIEGAIARLQEG